jgi:hypothetical protein
MAGVCAETYKPPCAFVPRQNDQRRNAMPVLLLWAIPAVIVIGGGGYWLMHLH